MKVLAVDDNQEGLYVLEEFLRSKGFQVVTASSGKETLTVAETELPDLILLDINMPEPDGFEVTRILRAHSVLRYTPIILLTARDEVEDIVFGLDLGADDYVKKPFNPAELLARIKAVSRVRELYQTIQSERIQNQEFRARFTRESAFVNIIGKSRAMQDLFSVMSKVIDSEVPVLITGESGTGKEVVAKAIHAQGPRKERAFVVQNCSAFNDNLLESELFGHVRGAFTGAVKDKQGLFEVADGGTFFLDELGEMSPALQVKLLRVLQDGSFTPVGGTKLKHSNVRIIAATHRDLELMVREGKFREDLFYRLNVINLRLPPLRDRTGDVPLLVEFILESIRERSAKPAKRLSPQAMVVLERYHWPGNIRQLENEIQRAVVMAGQDQLITEELLSPQLLSAPVSRELMPQTAQLGTLREAIERIERSMLSEALKESKGNKSEAARRLGISRSNLITKAEAFGLGAFGLGSESDD